MQYWGQGMAQSRAWKWYTPISYMLSATETLQFMWEMKLIGEKFREKDQKKKKKIQ